MCTIRLFHVQFQNESSYFAVLLPKKKKKKIKHCASVLKNYLTRMLKKSSNYIVKIFFCCISLLKCSWNSFFSSKKNSFLNARKSQIRLTKKKKKSLCWQKFLFLVKNSLFIYTHVHTKETQLLSDQLNLIYIRFGHSLWSAINCQRE